MPKRGAWTPGSRATGSPIPRRRSPRSAPRSCAFVQSGAPGGAPRRPGGGAAARHGRPDRANTTGRRPRTAVDDAEAHWRHVLRPRAGRRRKLRHTTLAAPHPIPRSRLAGTGCPRPIPGHLLLDAHAQAPRHDPPRHQRSPRGVAAARARSERPPKCARRTERTQCSARARWAPQTSAVRSARRTAAFRSAGGRRSRPCRGVRSR
jgi:hypothetical protein